jgi:hypothetical protein
MNDLVREFTNLLLNLDSLNVVSLTADHIDAGTINGNVVTIRSNLNDGAYIQIDGTGMTVFDGTGNTLTIDLDGNITMRGTLTASVVNASEINGSEINGSTMNASIVNGTEINGGTITGSLIQTSASSYPRAEMRSDSQIFMAAADVSNYMRIIASAAGVPSFTFGDGTNSGSLSFSNDLSGTKKTRLVAGNGIDFQSVNANIDFITGLFKTTFLDWNSIYNRFASQTLQQALDLKKNAGGGFAGAIPPGSTIFVTDGEITGYM